MRNFNRKIIYIFLLIMAESFSAFCLNSFYLKYHNIDKSQNNYKITMRNNIGKGQNAKVFMQRKSIKDSDGKIECDVSFYIFINNEKIGPFYQTFRYNRDGIIREDQNVDLTDNNRYIDLSLFYTQFPEKVIGIKEVWKNEGYMIDLTGNPVKILTENYVSEKNKETGTCIIKTKGTDKDKKNMMVREIEFDFNKGFILKSTVKLAVSFENKKIYSEMIMEKVNN